MPRAGNVISLSVKLSSDAVNYETWIDSAKPYAVQRKVGRRNSCGQCKLQRLSFHAREQREGVEQRTGEANRFGTGASIQAALQRMEAALGAIVCPARPRVAGRPGCRPVTDTLPHRYELCQTGTSQLGRFWLLTRVQNVSGYRTLQHIFLILSHADTILLRGVDGNGRSALCKHATT
ncbi:hypothetical protein MTO96_011933 [Rhipicephalus appendiculatus]